MLLSFSIDSNLRAAPRDNLDQDVETDVGLEDEPAPKPSFPQKKQEVTFPGGGLTLHGCIWKPEGNGPFPAVIWNHGSEKNPLPCGPKRLARAILDHGCVVFFPVRHGHRGSPPGTDGRKNEPGVEKLGGLSEEQGEAEHNQNHKFFAGTRNST